ncbi:MAG: hypothetical protein LZF61_10920 [Nitrosomonas sp.]|nr:MAG: hypothetical protein LZF61_10920 [Nitrosomonas sp.]
MQFPKEIVGDHKQVLTKFSDERGCKQFCVNGDLAGNCLYTFGVKKSLSADLIDSLSGDYRNQKIQSVRMVFPSDSSRIYGVDVSPILISAATDAVMDEVKQ